MNAGHVRLSSRPPMFAMDARALIAIAISAVLAKATLIVLLPRLTEGLAINFGMFPDGYDLIAANLADGKGYRMFEETSPTMVRTPGYVLVLAGLFRIFGHSLLAAQAANFVFSAVTSVLIYRIARQLFASDRIALLAALASAFHPAVLVADSRGGPESLMMLIVTIMFWLTLRVADSPTRSRLAWLGVAHGAGMLVKSSMAFLLPAACLWIMFRYRDSPRFLHTIVLGIFLAILASVAVQAPWIVRNYVVSDHFVPTMTVGGVAAFQGQYVVANKDTGREYGRLLDEAADQQVQIAEQMGLRARGYYFQQFPSAAEELAFYSSLSARTWQRYAEEPTLAGKAVLFNALAFWIQGQTQAVTTANALLIAPLLFLATLGAAMFHRLPEVRLALMFIVAYVAPHLVFMSLARYQTPLVPIVALLATFTLLRLVPLRSPTIIDDATRHSPTRRW